MKNFIITILAIIGLLSISDAIYKEITLRRNVNVGTPIETTTITWSQKVPKGFKGLAGFNLEKGVCEIYAPIPRNENDTERLTILGHEVLHCFVGKYHE